MKADLTELKKLSEKLNIDAARFYGESVGNRIFVSKLFRYCAEAGKLIYETENVKDNNTIRDMLLKARRDLEDAIEWNSMIAHFGIYSIPRLTEIKDKCIVMRDKISESISKTEDYIRLDQAENYLIRYNPGA